MEGKGVGDRERVEIEKGLGLRLRTLALPSLLFFCLCLCLSGQADARVYPPLYLPAGRPMRILILTDIHYGEFEGEFQGSLQDGLSSGVTENLLDLEKPDFVVVLGDLVTGENLQRQFSPISFVKDMLLPLVARRVPYASTYGNHDISPVLRREDILRFDMSLPRSYTQRQTLPAVSGLTNFALPIRSRGIISRPLAALLVFLDSRGVTGLGQGAAEGTNWVTAGQVAFLRRVLQSNPGVPTYVFVHIPPPQFQGLQDNFLGNQCVGLHEEPQLGVQGKDEGLWSALIGSDQVLGVFSGHNHGTGWCCKAARGAGRRPLGACNARHSGYGGYGDWPKGGRMISIDAAQKFKLTTWVRGVDGTLLDPFNV